MNASNRLDILMHVQAGQMLLLRHEQIIDLAVGDLGATGLTLSAKVPDVQDAIVLSADEDNLQAMRLAPGTMFHPSADLYTSTRLRPQVSPSLKARHPIPKIIEAVRDRQLHLCLRLSALHDAAVAAKHPDVVSCNALSLPLTSHLCPSNADIVELIRCQLVDLVAQFQPDSIEMEDITAPDKFDTSRNPCNWPAQPGPVELALLAICFCPSCQQQAIHAGLDASLALRSVQVYLKRWLQSETPHPGTIDDLLADDEILGQYVARQKQALLAAIQIWTRAAQHVSLLVAGDRAVAPWNPSSDELAALTPQFETVLDITSPAFTAGPDIVRCLGDIARADIAMVVLENGLTVSPTRRAFLRQAIRTARRERIL